jgi:hypothetical protein
MLCYLLTYCLPPDLVLLELSLLPITRQLVVQGSHGQVDGSSSHPARLIGSHEDRHVCHLLECHKPSRVGPACEQLLELFPSHFRYLGASFEGEA